MDEKIDPLLNTLVNKNFIYKVGRKYIKIEDEEIEYKESEIKIYLVSNLYNPKFSPAI